MAVPTIVSTTIAITIPQTIVRLALSLVTVASDVRTSSKAYSSSCISRIKPRIASMVSLPCSLMRSWWAASKPLV